MSPRHSEDRATTNGARVSGLSKLDSTPGGGGNNGISIGFTEDMFKVEDISEVARVKWAAICSTRLSLL